VARILATGKVRLSIASTGLRREIQAAIKEAATGVREKIRIDIDVQDMTRQVDRAARDTRARIRVDVDDVHLRRQLAQLGNFSGRVLSSLISGRLFTAAGRAIRDYGAAIAALLPFLAGLAQGLTTATRALALLPAIAVAAAAVIGTLAVGFRGLGEALKNMDDLAAFNEALKNLSPNARDFARAIRRMRGEFKSLRLHVQERLFAGMDEVIERLARRNLPVLRKGLGGIAGELGRGFKMWARWASEAETVKDTGSILKNVKNALRELAPAGRDFAAALTDIVKVGSDFLPELADGAREAAARFREFIREARQTGRLREWLREGIREFGALFRLLRNIGSILSTVFQGITGTESGFLQAAEKMTDRWRKFLKSIEGQQSLRTLNETLKAISAALRQVLSGGFEQFGDILRAILPFLAEFTKIIGGALVAALKIVGPLLENIAEFMSANKDWLAPVIAGMLLFTKGLNLLQKPLKLLAAGLLLVRGRAKVAGAALGAAGLAGAIGGRGGRGGLLGVVGKLAKGGLILTIANELGAFNKVSKRTGEEFSVLDKGLRASALGWSAIPALITGNEEALRNIRREGHDIIEDIFGAPLRDLPLQLQGVNKEFLTTLGSLQKTRSAEERIKNLAAVTKEFGKEGVKQLKFLGEDLNAIGQQLRDEKSVDEWRKKWIDLGKSIGGSIKPAVATGISEFLRARTSIGESVDALRKRSTDAFSGIRNAFLGVGQSIRSSGATTFTSVGKSAGNLRNHTETVFERIKHDFVRSATSIGGTAATQFGKVAAEARKGSSGAASAFGGLGKSIANSIGNLSHIGRNAASQVASGILDGLGLVRSAAAGIGAAIRGALPGSPAEYGPLSGSGYPLLLGRKVTEQVAQGIRQQQDVLRQASIEMAQTVRTAISAPVTAPTVRFTGPGGILTGPGGRAGGPGAGGVVLQQTNVMRPGTDVRQFSEIVLQRGMTDLLSGVGTLSVSRQGVQAGVNDQLMDGVRL